MWKFRGSNNSAANCTNHARMPRVFHFTCLIMEHKFSARHPLVLCHMQMTRCWVSTVIAWCIELLLLTCIKLSNITFCPCLTARAKQSTMHPVPQTQTGYLANSTCCLVYFPLLFGNTNLKKKNKPTVSKKISVNIIITIINKRSVMLIRHWINPVVCWYCLLTLYLVSD